jgi:hypothetical protein
MKAILTSCRKAAARAWPWLAVAMILGPVLLALGCSQPPLEKSEPPTIAKHAQTIRDKAEDQINRTEAIDKHADEAAKVPGAEEPAAAIKAESKEIRADAHAIHASATDLRAMQERIDKLAGERDKAIDRAQKAEQEATRWENRTLAGIRIASGLAVAVSVALMVWGTLRTALPTLIAAALFVGTLFVQVTMEYRLMIGLGCAAVTVGALIYELWIKKRTIREVVETVDESLRSVNGKLPDEMVRVAGLVQSKTTAALIDGAQGNGPINKLRRWLGGFIAGQPVAVKV